MITSKQLRQKYIDFFIKKGHKEIPSGSLIPENDPSVLFTTAGMHPLAPFLLGERHPQGRRLVNLQKCIRTTDVDEVGDRVHHSFFEMLGHWSLGDYFKQEAIKMSWEFLTQELGLDPKRLAFSVFAGNQNAQKDEEAAMVWKSFGVREERIAYLPKEQNWWEPAGSSGPCGPCTEMFYWSDNKNPVPESFDPKDKRWVEVGNDVLMQYEKIGENKYQIAKQKNIDNGTGLERTLAVLNGLDDNYQTDLFLPIINKIEELSGKKYGFGGDVEMSRLDVSRDVDNDNVCSMRIITDHIRAATFILGDDTGITPSNIGQGYVVRKLIRRAIRHGRMIGIQDNFIHKIGEVVINLMRDIYIELEKNKKFILDNLITEEEKFTWTLQQGLKEFNRTLKHLSTGTLEHKNTESAESNFVIDGETAFNLFQTYGFPLELTKELAMEKGFSVDEKGFENEMKKHQEMSRTAAAGKFKGGLADQSEQVIKYHTTAHLMLAALRQVFGSNIIQKGSNITAERLRFDFSHSEKLTDDEKKKIEDLVNEWIMTDFKVSFEEMSLDDARKKGAMGVFENKYGDRVKVYTIGNGNNIVSREICGGPHVEWTGILGKFRIKKEESSSSGVRRIKAVLE